MLNNGFLDRRLKGTYGYIRKQLIFEIVKTLILFAMAIGIFLIGYLTLHTKKSLWSIFAVLALLPACRSMVGVVMLARYRSLSADAYSRYERFTKELGVIFENIITTSDKSYFIPVICVSCGNVVAYYPEGDKDNTLKKHMDNVLKNAGHSANVKIFDSEEAFINRCSEMTEKLSDNSDNSKAAILNTLKAVSL